MILLKKPISKSKLKKIAENNFGNLVKAVVDISKEIIVIDAGLHADEEAYLLNLGSKQDDLWGINLYPDMDNDNMVEFDSMINIRPRQKNLSRGIDNPEIQIKIRHIVGKFIK